MHFAVRWRIFSIIIFFFHSGSAFILQQSVFYCHDERKPQKSLICPSRYYRIDIMETRFFASIDDTCYGSEIPACEPKIEYSDLVDCDGRSGHCDISYVSPVEVCGKHSSRFYIIFSCTIMIIERSVTWKINSESTNLKISCPQGMSIVIKHAVAGIQTNDSHLPIRCPTWEGFTSQVTRACHGMNNVCDVSAIATNYRCEGNPARNDISFVNFDCIPSMKQHEEIERFNICNIGSINTSISTEGYILTPEFPLSYPSYMNCLTQLLICRGCKMKLYVLEFDVLYPHSLNVETEMHNFELHAKDIFARKLLETNSGNVNLTFKSNFMPGRKGMKLYFKAERELDSRFNRKSQPVKGFADQQSVEKRTTNEKIPYGKRRITKSNRLIYVLLGIMICLIVPSCILIAATAILLYRRRKTSDESLKYSSTLCSTTENERQLLRPHFLHSCCGTLKSENQYEEVYPSFSIEEMKHFLRNSYVKQVNNEFITKGDLCKKCGGIGKFSKLSNVHHSPCCTEIQSFMKSLNVNSKISSLPVLKMPHLPPRMDI